MAWIQFNWWRQPFFIVIGGIVNVLTFVWVSASLGQLPPVIATAGIFSLMAMVQVGFLALASKQWLWSWIVVSFLTLLIMAGLMSIIPTDSLTLASGWRILVQILPPVLVLSIAQWYWILRPLTDKGKWWIAINIVAVVTMAIFTAIYDSGAMLALAGTIIGMLVMAFIQGAGIVWVGYGADQATR